MNQNSPFIISEQVELEKCRLVASWAEDVGQAGPKTIDYIVTKLDAQEIAEVNPTEFFSLNGVVVERDIAQFPQGRLYCSKEKMLLLLKSSAPRCDWHRFLDSTLSLCQKIGPLEELYAIGGMVTFSSHTAPRELVPIANTPVMKELLSQYGLPTGFDYETPLGQRPTLGSYMLWVAKRREISGVGLWATVPFYLMSTKDPRACKRALQFLNERLDLGLDFADLNREIDQQDEAIENLRMRVPEVDGSFQKLEGLMPLTQEEHERLMKEVENLLGRGE